MATRRNEEAELFMKLALAQARKGFGATSPNPMVGAILVSKGRIIGRGWHRGSGHPHAEVEAILDCQNKGASPKGATLYVTLEPCSTHGRTPPCTSSIIQNGIQKVVAGAVDPNPVHSGKAFPLLQAQGVSVQHGILEKECELLNEAFNHWIVHRTPFVTLKAGTSMDGKIATAFGESKWITGPKARALGMKLRKGSDAVLVGINTVLADDPSLTVRGSGGSVEKVPWRVVVDCRGRIAPESRLLSDSFAGKTILVMGKNVPASRRRSMEKRALVWILPENRTGGIQLKPLLKKLGEFSVLSLLVEGGGEVHASFLEQKAAHRICFFYAPLILGGRLARKSVGGRGFLSKKSAPRLKEMKWSKAGEDLLLQAKLDYSSRTV